MKSNAWKKEYFVISHNDYDNTWVEKTIKCTYLQAVRYISAKNWHHRLVKGSVRIVSIAELQALKGLL